TFTIKLSLRTGVEEIYVPIQRERIISPDKLQVPTEKITSLEGVRVLICDDEADIRELFTMMLEQYGAEVTAVSSMREALAALTANPNGYDVLLSDIGLPEEDGYDLIRQVRALDTELGGQIPAAALTAYTGDAERAE